MTSQATSKRPVVITHALRTPIGKYLGGLSTLTAADLGTSVVTDLLGRAKLDPARVDEVLMGCGRQAGGGPNLARQVTVRAGIPVATPAMTVNMACGSGLKTILLAAESIQSGRNDVVVAGGAESMSGLPFFLPKMRTGYRLGHAKVVDAMYQDGFLCPLSDMLMGETAERLAQDFGISRDEQDGFALESQQKAAQAIEAGHFANELSPVTVKGRKGDTVVDADEHVRPQTRLESLAKLPAVFAKVVDEGKDGTVTPGNASGITDGASAVLVMGADTAESLGLEPLAILGESTQAGVDPAVMGLGPVPAVRALAEKNGKAVGDYDLIELNEAFAAQVLACHRELDLPMERVNVNGGAIALGHPIGATGTRIVVTMLHELARRKADDGLATLCISGGLGLAAHFTRKGL